MDETPPLGTRIRRTRQELPCTLQTIIVAPELLAELLPFPDFEVDGAGVEHRQHPSCRDAGHAQVVPARPCPTTQFAHQEVTERVTRKPSEGTLPAILLTVSFMLGFWASSTWLLSRERADEVSSRGGPRSGPVIRQVAGATGAVRPLVAPATVHALASGPAVGSTRVVSKVTLIRGRTNRPLRAVRAALNRSSASVGSCVSPQRLDAARPLAGLNVSLRVRADGSVVWVQTTVASARIVYAIPCIDEALRATEFPTSEEGLRVDAELTFTPP